MAPRRVVWPNPVRFGDRTMCPLSIPERNGSGGDAEIVLRAQTRIAGWNRGQRASVPRDRFIESAESRKGGAQGSVSVVIPGTLRIAPYRRFEHRNCFTEPAQVVQANSYGMVSRVNVWILVQQTSISADCFSVTAVVEKQMSGALQYVWVVRV